MLPLHSGAYHMHAVHMPKHFNFMQEHCTLGWLVSHKTGNLAQKTQGNRRRSTYNGMGALCRSALGSSFLLLLLALSCNYLHLCP